MPAQDTSGIKEKIMSILGKKGPSLPVHIAKEIELSILFTSAFLSELASEKRIKISYIKIGNSPLYYLPGQKPLLEKFSHYLKDKEREAFMFLKEKKFLKDSEQAPAIRVALREIKDFAVPFLKEKEIIWRFFSVPEEEFVKEEKPIAREIVKEKTHPGVVELEKPIVREIKEIKTKAEEKEKTLDIFDTPKKRKRKTQKKTPKKSKKEGDFFNKTKEFLAEKSIELFDIISFDKNQIILRIKDNEGEKIMIVYNKKRINDSDIIRAAKKSSEFNLPYIIVSLGEPLKKIHELIEAIKNLHSIEKLK
jgi:hypothetical protein